MTLQHLFGRTPRITDGNRAVESQVFQDGIAQNNFDARHFRKTSAMVTLETDSVLERPHRNGLRRFGTLGVVARCTESREHGKSLNLS